MAKHNLQVTLEGIYEQYKNNQHGNVANYLPSSQFLKLLPMALLLRLMD